MLPDFLFASEAEAARPPLRVGLIVDEHGLPRFLAESIGYIARSTWARLELVVRRTAEPPAPLPLLYRLYAAWDHRQVSAAEDPLALVEVGSVAQGAELVVASGSAPPAASLSGSDVARIREARLDVILHCGATPVRGEVLAAAKHGVWMFGLGEDNTDGRHPAYFWEVRDSTPVSSLALRNLSADHNAKSALSTSVVSTVMGLSQVRNTFRPCWGGTTLVIQKLRELHERGEIANNRLVTPADVRTKANREGPPSNTELATWLVPDIGRRVVRRLRRLGQSHVPIWRLAVRVGGQPLVGSSRASLEGFRWIDAPPGHFFADPFLIEEGEAGSPWLFFEDYDYAVKRGRLSCAPLNPDGSLGTIQCVLDRPYHLSYPYLFRHDGALYMVPETHQASRVDLYRCVQFPDRWDFERTLLPFGGLDSSIWIEDGRCWLFTTLTTSRATAPQLWLFSAPSLAGPWRVHPASPISTDVRNARSAGAIFRHGSTLVRSSQDCGIAYGHSFTLNAIVELSAGRFEERPLVTVGPEWSPGLVGTHSYAIAGSIECVDGCTIVPADRAGAPRR